MKGHNKLPVDITITSTYTHIPEGEGGIVREGKEEGGKEREEGGREAREGEGERGRGRKGEGGRVCGRQCDSS